MPISNGNYNGITLSGSTVPFPSTIDLSQVPGFITHLSIHLAGFYHPDTTKLRLLLVGPTGETCLLFANGTLGDSGSASITNTDIVFDDYGVAPTLNTPTFRIIKPTQDNPIDVPGAPAGPYGPDMQGFIGTDANGTWSLYLYDDAPVDDTSLMVAGWDIYVVYNSGEREMKQFSMGGVTITDNDVATVYPLTVDIEGCAGVPEKAVLILNNFTHTSPADVSMLLMNNSGAYTMAFSGPSGITSDGDPVSFAVDDEGENEFTGALASVNYHSTPGQWLTTNLNSPAPPPFYSQYEFRLFPLCFVNPPNGTWSLYIQDNSAGGSGAIGEVILKLFLSNQEIFSTGGLSAAGFSLQTKDGVRMLYDTPLTIHDNDILGQEIGLSRVVDNTVVNADWADIIIKFSVTGAGGGSDNFVRLYFLRSFDGVVFDTVDINSDACILRKWNAPSLGDFQYSLNTRSSFGKLPLYWKLAIENQSGDQIHAQVDYTTQKIVVPGDSTTQAVEFSSASSQLASHTSSADFSITGDFWVAGWTRKTSGTFAIMFGKEGSTGRDYDMFTSGASAFFSLWDDSENRFDAVAPITIFDNGWYFVLGWYDSVEQTINVQVNRSPVYSTPFTGTPHISLEQFSIGGLSGDSLYGDSVADTTIFGKSPPGGVTGIIKEIGTTLFNAGNGIAARYLTGTQITNWGVVSGWDFDGDLVDAIGGNDLSGQNGPTFTNGTVH